MADTTVTVVAVAAVIVIKVAVAVVDTEVAMTVATIAAANLQVPRPVQLPRPPPEVAAPQTMLLSMRPNTMAPTLTLRMVVTRTTLLITNTTNSMLPLSNSSSSNSPRVLLLPLLQARHPLHLPQVPDHRPLLPVLDLPVPARAATAWYVN
jgi:hypothetical protein